MNDNQSPAFRAALDAVAAAPHLRLVWSARLRPAGNCSPWERLHNVLLWSGFIQWLRQDVQDEP